MRISRNSMVGYRIHLHGGATRTAIEHLKKSGPLPRHLAGAASKRRLENGLAHRYLMLLACTGILAGSAFSRADDVKVIKIPRRSELTPVQRLNRKGVEAVKKHDYKDAESLFYKAYHYDPADPFTQNNKGYVSEL